MTAWALPRKRILEANPLDWQGCGNAWGILAEACGYDPAKAVERASKFLYLMARASPRPDNLCPRFPNLMDSARLLSLGATDPASRALAVWPAPTVVNFI